MMARHIPKNITQFNFFALALLEHLYESFPHPIEVDPSKVALNRLPENHRETIDQVFDAIEMAKSTTSFLISAGFVEHKGQQHNKYQDVRLTLKGLAVLGYSPEGTLRRRPIAELIREALDSASQAAMKEALSLVLKKGLASVSNALL